MPCGSNEASFFIAFEHSRKTLNKVRASVPVQRRLLVIFEPPAVNPSQHSLRVRARYARVLVPSKLQVIQEQDQVYYGGALHDQDEFQRNLDSFFDKPREAGTYCLVQQNKFSLVPGSMYTLRQQTAKFFQDANRNFSLAGKNWNISKTRLWVEQLYAAKVALEARSQVDLGLWRWRNLIGSGTLKIVGPVQSSIEFMADHEVAIVIENDPSYVTEKLFNALQAGTAVIYCGPNLDDFGIPQKIVKQVPHCPANVFQAASSLSKAEIEDMRNQALGWISQPEVREKWGYENSFKRISDLALDFLSD